MQRATRRSGSDTRRPGEGRGPIPPSPQPSPKGEGGTEPSPQPSPKGEGEVSKFASFSEFYPFYLSEHRNPTCRKLHFAGSALVLALIGLAAATANAWLLLLLPLVGYGFAWVGHFAFEKNRPATFQYPAYSLAGDWVMFWQLLTGKIAFEERNPGARTGADSA